ncbi:MAG TPA: TSUP family transporter [Candidatus Angelobacter sp.]|nr:TSUP family transporter [Candidatus Angelobacter sp.]
MITILLQILAGVLVGVLVGLTGTGGAFVIPMLLFVFGFEQLRAQGTALLISVFPVWIISFLPYYKTQNFDFKVAVLMALGIVVGSYFGATWAQHLPATVLRRLLGVVLVGLGVRFVVGR